jgi:NodT family efflux transporter outer membrane factor (OMF) lipoprotein
MVKGLSMLRTWIKGAGYAAVSSGLFLASCTVGPDHKVPESKLPETWHNTPDGATPEQPTELARWWTTLNDPALDSLIEKAVVGNHDLKIAAARLREARAQRGIVAADRLPNVDVNGEYSRSKASNSTGVPFGITRDEGDDLYQIGFDATWELDLWGRVRRSVEAADADIGAAAEDRRDVLIALLAEVARNYVELRSLQERLAIAESNVASQKETYELSKGRADAGITSGLDVARSEAQLTSTRAQIPALASQIRATTHRLAVLTGEQPGALESELSSAAALPVKPATVAVGIPSDLLRRRPDIRRAERELAAATARIGVARGDYFPRFSLTGSFGFSANEDENVFQGDSKFWSIGPTMRWPIFDAGRIRNNVEVQNARQEAALARYEQSILIGLEDVENSLVSYSREQARRQELVASEAAAKRAVELATALHSRGLTDFLSVLDSQRELYAIQDSRAVSDRTVLVNLISLYKALGGEWEQTAEVSAR